MAKITISFIFVLLFVDALAQHDSLFYEHWNRDPNADVTNTVSNQKQVITQEQILLSGYNLISDVLQLIDGFYFATWNGDRWNLASNGVGNYQNQNWVLLLDGVKLDLLKIDAQNVNSMGISVFDIERIEIINASGNYLGEFNDKGIIHIITKQNSKQFNYRLLLGNGNESGDPHLNAVNNPGLNVHEYGTVLSQFIGFKGKKWSINTTQYANNYFYRDTVTFSYPTVKKYNYNPNPYNTLLSGRVMATYQSKKATHQLSVNLNHADDVILPASIYTPVTGSNKFYNLAYVLRYKTTNGYLQYRGSYTNRFFNGNDYEQRINHTQQTQWHNLSFTSYKNTKNLRCINQVGIELNHIVTTVNLNISQNHFDYQIRPYYSITYPINKKSNLFSDLSLGTDFNFLFPKVLVGYYKQPSIISNWSIVSAYTLRNHFQNNTYPYLLSIQDTSNLLIPINQAELFTLDYFFNLNVSKYFKFSFNSGIKYTNNELYFVPNENATNNTFSTTTKLVNQTIWLNRFNLFYNMNKGLQVNLNYVINNQIGSQPDVAKAIPKHKLSVVLSKTLPFRFYLWTRYYYQSTTYFINPYITQQANLSGITSQYTTVNALHALDIGMTKKMIQDFLIINLSVRNVFNNTEKYQANGASFKLRLFLSVKINI